MNHPRVDPSHPAFFESSVGRALLAGYGARASAPALRLPPRIGAGRASLLAGCFSLAMRLASSLGVARR